VRPVIHLELAAHHVGVAAGLIDRLSPQVRVVRGEVLRGSRPQLLPLAREGRTLLAATFERALKSAGVPNVTFQKIQVIPRGQVLLFLPVWVVRYAYRGRSYFATFDGVTGASISGRAPGDPLAQSLAMAGGATLGGFAIALGLWAAGLGVFESPALPVALGLVAGFAAWAGAFWFFRHGSEILEGDLPKEYARAGRARR